MLTERLYSFMVISVKFSVFESLANPVFESTDVPGTFVFENFISAPQISDLPGLNFFKNAQNYLITEEVGVWDQLEELISVFVPNYANY